MLVDGNRIAGFEGHVGPYTAIVDGDAIVYTIACASVVAKVIRDRMITASPRGTRVRLGPESWLRDRGSTARRCARTG